MADVYRQTEIVRPAGYAAQPNVHLHTDPAVGAPVANLEASEMAAFEKGRMQGEMEAIRRMEAEQAQLKQFPAEPVAPVVLAQPDVVEINRMTWPQRISTVMGELTGIAYLIMLISWVEEYRGGFGWSNASDGDARGNYNMWNTALLFSFLGLFCNTQALLMYRILPLRTPAFVNRLIYTFWQCAALAAYSIAIAGWVKSTPETTWWGAEKWCYSLGFAVYGLHALYSMARTWLEPIRAVHADTWNETPNTMRDVLMNTPEQNRDNSTYNQAGRTLYAPQPHTLTNLGRRAELKAEAHAAHHNASGIAPRWSEFPTYHAEDYFLLPRAKWAVCGFFGMGAPILMTLAVVQNVLATGHETWAQYNLQRGNGPLTEDTREARFISAIGVILLASILFVAYAAMPPRTTLVKNGGVLVDANNANRRSSISHNAETRLGHNVV